MDVEQDQGSKAFDRLVAERMRLQALVGALAEEGVDQGSEHEAIAQLSSIDQHPADVGTELFERERNLSVREGVDAALADVARALDRLEAGAYGTCEACGRPIDAARLEAKPAARFCIDDHHRAERRAAAG